MSTWLRLRLLVLLLLGSGVRSPPPTLLDRLGLWLLFLLMSCIMKFFFRYFLLGDLLPRGDFALDLSMLGGVLCADFDGEGFDGEKVSG